jgi:hypothetical protein
LAAFAAIGTLLILLILLILLVGLLILLVRLLSVVVAWRGVVSSPSKDVKRLHTCMSQNMMKQKIQDMKENKKKKQRKSIKLKPQQDSNQTTN